MSIKTVGLKVAGGALAVAFVVAAMAGHTGRAGADGCKLGPCPAIDTRPDLVVNFVEVAQHPQGWPMARFGVRNQGLSNAGTFTLKVLINGQVVNVVPVAGLWAGDVTTFVYWPLPAGGSKSKTSIEVVLDTNNEIDESNELNNVTQAVLIY